MPPQPAETAAEWARELDDAGVEPPDDLHVLDLDGTPVDLPPRDAERPAGPKVGGASDRRCSSRRGDKMGGMLWAPILFLLSWLFGWFSDQPTTGPCGHLGVFAELEDSGVAGPPLNGYSSCVNSS